MNYLEKLKISAEHAKSIVCMGLDPLLDKMPDLGRPLPRFHIEGFFELLLEEMRRTGIVPGAFKLNDGFYNVHDSPRGERTFQGSVAMANVMDTINSKFPGIPVILDNRTGSGTIYDESKNYAVHSFESWKPDAVIVVPNFGVSSMQLFFDYCGEKGKGVYILNKTSDQKTKKNLESYAKKREDIYHINEVCVFRPLAAFVANNVVEWAQKNPGIGIFIDTNIEELVSLAGHYKEKCIPLLIECQDGKVNLSEAAEALKKSGYDLSLARINLSTDLIHPWVYSERKPDKKWLEMCIEELRKANKSIDYK